MMICNRDLIKQIAVKDFDYFVNHRTILDAQAEPLFGNSLFFLQDQKWRDMRATLSPAFTGSKMRLMFQMVNECGHKASKYLRTQADSKGPIEMDLMDFFTRFTNDVIAICAFGVEINSLTEKDNHFYNMSRKATNFTGLTALKFFLFSNFPRLMRLLRIRLFDESYANTFSSLVLDTMEERITKGTLRPDMINLLLEARKGTVQVADLGTMDSNEGFATVEEAKVGQKAVSRHWTDDDLVSQCFLFFIAGFLPSSILMCFCAHEVMENPDVQKKLIEEIDHVREELGDNPLTYDVLQKMKYMDMVMSETLRKWPPTMAIDRVCSKPYVLRNKDGDGVKLNRGDIVSIPIVGLHHNPDYFPEPDKFIPERFSDENRNNIKPLTYLPFGIGPRGCIGSRFALMESKAILFHLLSQFTFEASPKTRVPLEAAKSEFHLLPEGGSWMNLKPRS
ncbi:probable cytochrome P450 9f2 [Hermetia illucens]|nr:probable cytochrome P450 9f2 [Hermetia illucens]